MSSFKIGRSPSAALSQILEDQKSVKEAHETICKQRRSQIMHLNNCNGNRPKMIERRN